MRLLFSIYFAVCSNKCFRTAYRSLHRMFDFNCSLIRLYKKKHTSPFFYNNHKPLPHLELAFKRSLNVSFLNWGISLEVHPRMFSSFSWGIFDYIMRLDLSHAGKSICWFITSNKALCYFQNIADKSMRYQRFPVISRSTDISFQRNVVSTIYYKSLIYH